MEVEVEGEGEDTLTYTDVSTWKPTKIGVRSNIVASC